MAAPTNSTTPRIFISYRRADSAASCSHLYDRLITHFGKDAIFKDVDDIPYGVKFPDYLAAKLTGCRVELVIIGKLWLTLTAPDGTRRLDAPNDFVRIEIEHGMQGGLVIIPVLVDNATMPHANDLPTSLRELVDYHAAQVRYDPDFSTDIERLIRQLDRLLGIAGSGSAPEEQGVAVPASTPATSPADPALEKVRQQTPLIEAAVAATDWTQVLDRCRYLKANASQAMPIYLWRTYGLACLEEGESQEGNEALVRALQLNPDDLATLRAAARACHQLGDDTLAATHLSRALGGPVYTQRERVEVLREYLPILLSLHNWQETLRRAMEGERLTPEETIWPDAHLRALLELHREAEALTLARILTARSDATLDWWLTRARLVHSVADDDNEVYTALAAAERVAPNSPALAQVRRELLPSILAAHFPERLASLGFTEHAMRVDGKAVEYIVPPLCAVPAGPFLMGSDSKRDPMTKEIWAKGEQPQHTVTLAVYQIARYPVTVAEYACFVRAGQSEPSQWQEQLGKLDHPVVNISWHNAFAYAKWLAERTSQPWRLPSEAEWEKAARGTDGRIYPWGETFDKSRCNTSESGASGTTPVGSYHNGASPYGVLDMAGNVREWTSTVYKQYPYTVADGREDVNSTENRVLRGGSWVAESGLARAAHRNYAVLPVYFSRGNGGFRLVLASPIL